MVEVEIMPSAIEDIKGIIDYVFHQSVQNAEKLYDELLEKINSLQNFPERGSVVKEIISPPLREIKLHHFRIIYKTDETKVQVLTVHHSSRLLVNNPHINKFL